MSLDFPDTGLVLICATNLDTNGSSGSGKSSINQAILYGLGASEFSTGSLQSWNTEDPMSVRVCLEKDGHSLEIIRSAKGPSVKESEALLTGASAVEAKIAEFIGLDSAVVKLLTYRGQKKTSAFLTMTDSDKKDFLSQILGLDKIETAIDESAAKEKTLELDSAKAMAGLSVLQTNHQQLESQVSEAMGKLASLPTPEPLDGILHLKEAAISKRDSLLFRKKEEISTVEAEFAAPLSEVDAKIDIANREMPPATVIDAVSREELAEAKRRLSAEKNADMIRRSELDRARSDRQKDESTLIAQEKEVSQTKDRLLVIEHQQKSITESCKCPTCEKPWDSKDKIAQKSLASLLDESTRLQKNLLNLETSLGQLKIRLDAPSSADFEPSQMIPVLEGIVADLSARIAGEQAMAMAARDLFEAEKRAKLAKLNGERTSIHFEMSAKKMKVGETFDADLQAANDLIQHVERQEGQAMLLQKEFDQLTAAVAKSTAALTSSAELVAQKIAETEDLRNRLNAEKDFQLLMGRTGFLSSIFDEVLAEISEEINKIVGAIPNTSHVSVSFSSESYTQKGSIKKKILPVVSVGGQQTSLAAGLSGGMQTSVDLAVDLAILSVVSRRTGVSPGWLILDEAFDGLDVTCKEAVFEMLQRHAQDKLILVIDHSSETKELFSQVIEIVYKNGESTFK